MWIAEATRIFTGLKERLGLRERPASPTFHLREIIVPVTSVDEILAVAQILVASKDPGATGYTTVHTVPRGKRWTVYAYHMVRPAGGTSLTIDEIAITNGTDRLELAAFTATTERREQFTNPLKLMAGWTVAAEISAYTAGDLLQSTIYITEEDAF